MVVVRHDDGDAGGEGFLGPRLLPGEAVKEPPVRAAPGGGEGDIVLAQKRAVAEPQDGPEQAAQAGGHFGVVGGHPAIACAGGAVQAHPALGRAVAGMGGGAAGGAEGAVTFHEVEERSSAIRPS